MNRYAAAHTLRTALVVLCSVCVPALCSAFPKEILDELKRSNPERATVLIEGSVTFRSWNPDAQPGAAPSGLSIDRYLNEEEMAAGDSNATLPDYRWAIGMMHGTIATTILFADPDTSVKSGETYWSRRSTQAKAAIQVLPGGDRLEVTPFHGLTLTYMDPPIPGEVSRNLGPIVEMFYPRRLLEETDWQEHGPLAFLDATLSFKRRITEGGDTVFMGVENRSGGACVKIVSVVPVPGGGDGSARSRVTIFEFDRVRLRADGKGVVIAAPESATFRRRVVHGEGETAVEHFDDPGSIVYSCCVTFRLDAISFDEARVLDVVSPQLGRVAISLAVSDTRDSQGGESEVSFKSYKEAREMDRVLRESPNSPFQHWPVSLRSAGSLRPETATASRRPSASVNWPSRLRMALFVGGSAAILLGLLARWRAGR